MTSRKGDGLDGAVGTIKAGRGVELGSINDPAIAVNSTRVKELILASDPLLGRVLPPDRQCDRRAGRCRRTGIVEPGAGRHCYALRCHDCGAHRGSLKKHAVEISRDLHADGRLGTRPVLRDQSIVSGRIVP